MFFSLLPCTKLLVFYLNLPPNFYETLQLIYQKIIFLVNNCTLKQHIQLGFPEKPA